MKKVCFLFLVLIIAGCSTNKKYDPETFDPNSEGIVLLKAVNKTIGSLWISESRGYYILKKFGEDQENIYESAHPSILNGKDYVSTSMVLTPGIYYIDSIAILLTDKSSVQYPTPGLIELKLREDQMFLVKYGAFEVKAGDIKYLGLLRYNYGRGFSFSHEEDAEINDARKDFRDENYDDIAKKITPGTFYKSGSVIVKTKDGLEVIPADSSKNPLN